MTGLHVRACGAGLIALPQARYQRHDSPISRLVSNVQTTALQRRLNRTANDPIYLAAELQRWCLCKTENTTKFFKRRLPPTIQRKSRALEECTASSERRAHMQVHQRP